MCELMWSKLKMASWTALNVKLQCKIPGCWTALDVKLQCKVIAENNQSASVAEVDRCCFVYTSGPAQWFPTIIEKNHCVLMVKGRQRWFLLLHSASRSMFAARWFWGSICATPQEQSTTVTGWRACTISWEPGFTACASVLIASRHNVGYRVITRWNCVISGRIF